MDDHGPCPVITKKALICGVHVLGGPSNLMRYSRKGPRCHYADRLLVAVSAAADTVGNYACCFRLLDPAKATAFSTPTRLLGPAQGGP